MKTLKKTPQKVAYLRKISVVSEIFHNTAQQPKWQNSCSQIWQIEQLYIELGLGPYMARWFVTSAVFTWVPFGKNVNRNFPQEKEQKQ